MVALCGEGVAASSGDSDHVLLMKVRSRCINDVTPTHAYVSVEKRAVCFLSARGVIEASHAEPPGTATVQHQNEDKARREDLGLARWANWIPVFRLPHEQFSKTTESEKASGKRGPQEIKSSQERKKHDVGKTISIRRQLPPRPRTQRLSEDSGSSFKQKVA
ncbi:hypothetical protein MRX96_007921 [Rhipicephalus microplus]